MTTPSVLGLRAMLCVFALCCCLLASQNVLAVQITVINTNDSGAGSLRQAIADAVNGDEIVFDATLNGSPITIASELLINGTRLTITGNGESNTIIQANANPGTANYRVFNISGAEDVQLSSLTIRHGNVNDEGGGIFLNLNAANTLTLNNVTLHDNRANGPNAGGGILRNEGILICTECTFSSNRSSATGGGFDASGVAGVTFIRCTFKDNQAIQGGAMELNSGFTALISNSTFTGNNTTAVGGGAISVNFVNATVTITASTISGNSASTVGGGIWGNQGTVNLRNSIVAGNSGPGGGPDLSGTINSQGYNCVGITDGNVTINTTTGDNFSCSPNLQALADNGGATQTMAITTASTDVLNVIPSASCVVSTDQRNYARPQGGSCDIGAFELRYFTLGITKTGTGSGVVSGSQGAISCGATCTASYPINTALSLTAAPDVDVDFDGWSGACSGTGNCGLTMDADKSVVANFTKHVPAGPLWLPALFSLLLLGIGGFWAGRKQG